MTTTNAVKGARHPGGLPAPIGHRAVGATAPVPAPPPTTITAAPAAPEAEAPTTPDLVHAATSRPPVHVDQAPAEPGPRPQVPAHLLPTARFAAVQHQQTTGQPITADELAARLSLTPADATALLTHLGIPAAPVTRVNGSPTTGGAR